MSPVISAGVSEDMAERLEHHREDGETRSECIRRYLRSGLDAENRGRSIGLGVFLMWVGSVFFAAAFMEATSAVGGIGLAIFAVGAVADQDRIERARETVRNGYKRLQSHVGEPPRDGED